VPYRWAVRGVIGMAEWFKRMSRGMKVVTILYALIVGFVLFANVRDYLQALNEARYALREGNTALAEEYLEYAHRRVKSIFITLFFFIPILVAPIVQHTKRIKGA